MNIVRGTRGTDLRDVNDKLAFLVQQVRNALRDSPQASNALLAWVDFIMSDVAERYSEVAKRALWDTAEVPRALFLAGREAMLRDVTELVIGEIHK